MSTKAVDVMAWIDAVIACYALESSRRVGDAVRELMDAAEALCAACEENFCCDGTDEHEPDDSKVSYPEDNENITFGMLRKLRASIAACQPPNPREGK